MKTSNFFSKNNKISISVCLILLAIHFPLSSQNRIMAFVTSENLYFIVPVVFVLGLGVFLMTAFLKQKNN